MTFCLGHTSALVVQLYISYRMGPFSQESSGFTFVSNQHDFHLWAGFFFFPCPKPQEDVKDALTLMSSLNVLQLCCKKVHAQKKLLLNPYTSIFFSAFLIASLIIWIISLFITRKNTKNWIIFTHAWAMKLWWWLESWICQRLETKLIWLH